MSTTRKTGSTSGHNPQLNLNFGAEKSASSHGPRDIREVSQAIRPLRFIDLFAGIGGFRKALENHGHECVFSSEIDASARRAYAANYGEEPAGDITQISAEEIPAHDILCGGFPCQPFSAAGKRLGVNEQKGRLFWEIIRIAKHHKPSVMLLENVKHILSIEGGKTIKEMAAELDAIGYDVTVQCLNASHFGVPQKRERAYITCVLRGSGVTFTPPIPTNEVVCLRDIIDPPEIPRTAIITRNDITLHASIPKSGQALTRAGNVGRGRMQGYRIYSLDGHAVTLTANGGGVGGQTGVYEEDGVVRRLNIGEAKRAMGFPTSHIVAEGGKGFKQLGNAVCPPMIEAVFGGLTFPPRVAERDRKSDEKYFEINRPLPLTQTAPKPNCSVTMLTNNTTATAALEVENSPTNLRDIEEVSLSIPEYLRGQYNEILTSSVSQETFDKIETLIDEAGRADKVDEHGSWDFGVEFDRKRGECSSLNWDIYGIGHDVHDGGLLAVIQVRSFYRKKEGWYPQIRKNYFLLGRNEDGTTFAHSVSSAVIHAAIRKEKDVVTAVQNWMFDGDYAGMLRQGDLALIPCLRRPSAPRLAERTLVLQGSHKLKASVIRRDGTVFAKKPLLTHVPGTHPQVQGDNKWYKIVVGKRATFWKFAAPTVD